MEPNPTRSVEDWTVPAMSLMRRPSVFDPSFVFDALTDGRDLPDVDLDQLTETILAGLSQLKDAVPRLP